MDNPRIYRARWHDYCSRCIYMITITKQRDKPLFSNIVGDYKISNGYPGCAAVSLTSLGRIIQRVIKALPFIEPSIKLLQYSIMPDHVHILLFVQKRIQEPIGKYIARMKVGINQECGIVGIFNHGFNDQILKSSRNLQVIYDYIRDNPRRLAVRMACPDYFQRFCRLKIGEIYYQAYGNIQLLDNPFKEPVIVHRADSPETRIGNRDLWLYTASNGGVLVSPFISPDEKAIRDKAIKIGGRIIVIRNEGFEKRFKPHGREFDLCAQGRLLLLAPWRDKLRRSKVSRAESLYMNSLAEKICYYEGAIKLIP